MYNVLVDINIPENFEKGNSSTGSGQALSMKRFFVPALIVLVGVGGFGLGKLVKVEESRPPVTVENFTEAAVAAITPPVTGGASSTVSTPVKTGKYLAARGGTAYYLPTCASAERIAEKNKIWFDTKEEAEKLGYRPAQNCKEMQ